MEKAGWIAVIVALITTAGVVASKYIEVGGRASSPTVAAGGIPAPTAATIAQLAGPWRDQFGSRFLFTVDANRVTLSGSNGDKLMNGSGSADADTLRLAIVNTADAGTIRCVGPIGSATRMTATCTDPDGSTFEWQLAR